MPSLRVISPVLCTVVWWNDARILVMESDDALAARVSDLLDSATEHHAAVEVVAGPAGALAAVGCQPPLSAALVAATAGDRDGLDAIQQLGMVHGVPVVAIAEHEDGDLWRAAAESGAPVAVATDTLDADRLIAALVFARETTLARRVDRIVCTRAIEVLSTPDGDGAKAVLQRIRDELEVAGIELVIRPTGIDADLAIVTTVGEVGPDTVATVVTQVAAELTVELTVHASPDRHLHHVEPALTSLCGLVLAAVEIEQVRRRTRTADESRYQSLAEHSPDPVLSVSPNGIVTLANASFRIAAGIHEIAGRPLPELATQSEIAGFASRAFEAVRHRGEEVQLDDQLVHRADGSIGYYTSRAIPEIAGVASPVHVILTETTNRVEQERRLAELALTDPLTGVANRRLGLDRLDHALARRSRHGGLVAACLLDLDHFKVINDLLGHQAGDEAVRIFSRRLEQTVRGADTVARLGGDEFLVVLEIPDRGADVAAIVERLHREVRGPAMLEGRSFELDASVGYAIAIEAEISGDELLARADRALYDVKRSGRGAVAHYDGQGWLFGSAAEMLRQLRRAVDEEQFLLRYQPITDSSGRTVAAEGLLRWDHPELGMRSPADFIAPLLDGPLAVPMGRWVVTEALEQLERWRRQGTVGDDFTMHVNVAPQQLPDIGLVSHILDELDRLGLGPDDLAVEVTEQSLFELDRSVSSLRRLRDAGVILMLDDFGTGASSLANLRSSVLAGIKIDHSFVSGVEDGGRDTAIVEGLLGLGSQSGLTVVAEGIERPSQREWFERFPDTRLQGFLFGRPLDAEDFGTRLAS